MMLEIPEAYNMAAQISAALTGRTITQAQAAQAKHGFAWYSGDPAAYSQLLAGRVIAGARAVAGQVQISAGDIDILLHDGVNIRYLSPKAKPPAKHQLHLSFDDGSALVCTVQMYGGMLAYAAGSNDNYYYTVAKEKPNPLTDEFSEDYFARLVEAGGPKLSVKALLATEQRIPGLGNGCLQDILFAAGLNPQSKAGALTDEQLAGLYRALKRVLADMATRGGRDTEKDFYGRPGGYATVLSAKTYTGPCPRCGGAITRKAYLGGNVYFCPACQS